MPPLAKKRTNHPGRVSISIAMRRAIDGVSLNGTLMRLRRWRSRLGVTGVSTVTTSTSMPASAARRIWSCEMRRSRAV